MGEMLVLLLQVGQEGQRKPIPEVSQAVLQLGITVCLSLQLKVQQGGAPCHRILTSERNMSCFATGRISR